MEAGMRLMRSVSVVFWSSSFSLSRGAAASPPPPPPPRGSSRHTHCVRQQSPLGRLQALQPRPGRRDVHAHGADIPREVHQPRLGPAGLGHLPAPHQAHRDLPALRCLGVPRAERRGVRHRLRRRRLVRGAYHHVRPWAAPGVHPPVLGVAQLGVRGEPVVVLRLAPHAYHHPVRAVVLEEGAPRAGRGCLLLVRPAGLLRGRGVAHAERQRQGVRLRRGRALPHAADEADQLVQAGEARPRLLQAKAQVAHVRSLQQGLLACGLVGEERGYGVLGLRDALARRGDLLHGAVALALGLFAEAGGL
mmetsp:Transcript_3768/g.13198  ORF Transcript_3768/g.13198 Transcript_3768/m.13198 type:complete len:305 (-) Transcript_3768:92-1006(-)